MTTPHGLSAKDRTRYAHRLVGADLAAERERAQALRQEAAAERGANPIKAEALEATAKERLALIAAEERQREALEGTPAEAFAESLAGAADADLTAQARELKKAAGGTQRAESRLKLMAVHREQHRREAAETAEKGQHEKARLDEEKAQLKASLAGAKPADLRRHRALEAVAVDAAEAQVRLAKSKLAGARTPGAKAKAQAAVAAAEAQLRTEYARRAVLNAQGGHKLDRRALHDFADTLKGQPAAALQQQRAKAEAALGRISTGSIKGSAEAIADAKARLAIVDQAIAKAEGKPAPRGPERAAPTTGVQLGPKHPTAGAQVWKEPGVWVANADAFPSDHAIAKMKAAGVKWVNLQVGDGVTLNEQAQRQLNAGFIQKLHDAGMKVGFWGVNRTEPEAEARLMADQMKKWGADFYVANAEMEYKYTGPDGKPDPTAFERSKRFVEAFRKELPDATAALSSYGRADMADLDWKVWRDAGFDWLPQAYLNDFDSCDPKLCVDGAVKAGWPIDRVHPTLGLWGGGQTRVVSAQEYEDKMANSGIKGFSSYLAEQMSEDDWAGLGRMVARGDLAE